MTIIFFLSLEFSHAQIHNNLNDGKFNTIMFKISSDKNDKISYLLEPIMLLEKLSLTHYQKQTRLFQQVRYC